MRSERDHHLARLLETFSGPDALPVAARRALTVRVTPCWDLAPPCEGADPAAWFPANLNRAADGVPIICGLCPVRRSCLATAILDDEHGIWGGTRRGQRLHARARLVNGDDVADVLAELLAMPMPATEYTVPEPVPVETPSRLRRQPNSSEAEWRAAS